MTNRARCQTVQLLPDLTIPNRLKCKVQYPLITAQIRSNLLSQSPRYPLAKLNLVKLISPVQLFNIWQNLSYNTLESVIAGCRAINKDKYVAQRELIEM